MMTFLERPFGTDMTLPRVNFSSEAVEGIVGMLFGDLTPEDAAWLDSIYSMLSEEGKMRVILKHIIDEELKVDL